MLIYIIQVFYLQFQIKMSIITQMNLEKSHMRGTLKRTTTPVKQIELQAELIENNLRKSYLYQMVEKSKGKSKKDKVIFQRQGSNILKKTSIGERRKIFQSALRTSNAPNKFKLILSNLGINKKQLNCCDSNVVKEPVVIYVSQYKQITIKNAKQTQVLFNFNFNTISAKINSSQLDQHSFILDICPRIVLKFQDNQNQPLRRAKAFRQMLQTIIESSIGLQFQMADLKQKQDFEKNRYKPVVQFAEHCQTGDILLFQGQQFWGKVQRFITNSQYDHVGMIYKDPIHGILIFESTSFSGTCLTPWEYVVKYKWYAFLDRIVWRKLNGVQRNDQFIQKMQNTIMDKLGKAYHISFDKLFSNQSYIYSPSKNQKGDKFDDKIIEQQDELISKEVASKDKQQAKQVGFFCSELVAVLYKDMSLLTRDSKNKYFKPSCNYYPYHFSEKFDLHLSKGSLSNEYIIHFNSEAIEDYYQFDN